MSLLGVTLWGRGLLAAAEARLPLVVPGYEDSTFGNIFASHVKTGECDALIAKSRVEYMVDFYDGYRGLSEGAGVGFFQGGAVLPGTSPFASCPRSSTTWGSP